MKLGEPKEQVKVKAVREINKLINGQEYISRELAKQEQENEKKRKREDRAEKTVTKKVHKVGDFQAKTCNLCNHRSVKPMGKFRVKLKNS